MAWPPWPPPTPFSRGFAPTEKEDSRFPTLTHWSPATTWAWEIPAWVTHWFFTLCRAFKWPFKNGYKIFIAKLCMCTKSALPWFGTKLSARMKFLGKGKLTQQHMGLGFITSQKSGLAVYKYNLPKQTALTALNFILRQNIKAPPTPGQQTHLPAVPKNTKI